MSQAFRAKHLNDHYRKQAVKIADAIEAHDLGGVEPFRSGVLVFGLSPDVTEVMRNYGRDLLAFNAAQLPFEKTVFCISIEADEGDPIVSDWLLSASQENGEISGQAYLIRGDRSSPNRVAEGYIFTLNVEECDAGKDDIPKYNCRGCRDGGRDSEVGKLWASFVSAYIGVLASKGVKQEIYQSPAFINSRRARKGKPPLMAGCALMFGQTEIQAPGLFLSSGRKSPKAHWRRGHVRRTSRGLAKIPPCLVNAFEPVDSLPPKNYCAATI